MSLRVIAVDHPELPPFAISERFRHEVAYFSLAKGDPAIPVTLGEHEYWIPLDEVRRIHEDGVVRLVSPLDSDATAELEITEEQEDWLDWVLQHGVRHIRLQG